MRTREEHDSAVSELRELDRLLGTLPDDRVLERIGLERRRERLRSELEDARPAAFKRPLRVTFRGLPVFGSKALQADFASEVVGKLNESVSAIAAGMRGPLSNMGPIPGRASALLVTGTARGSFGFEFGVPDDDQIRLPSADDSEADFELSETEAAVVMLRRLLETAATSSDDETLAELVDSVQPRSARKVREFLDLLHARHALCAVEFNGESFRLTDRGQLERGRRRLDDANITESTETLVGEVRGVLPNSRRFEFRVADDGRIIHARIGPNIGDPDVLNREYLHRASRVHLQVTRVGRGQPRYVLDSLSDVSPERSEP